jgi:hypothetical protein
MERGRSARTTHVARVTSLPHEPSQTLIEVVGDNVRVIAEVFASNTDALIA